MFIPQSTNPSATGDPNEVLVSGVDSVTGLPRNVLLRNAPELKAALLAEAARAASVRATLESQLAAEKATVEEPILAAAVAQIETEEAEAARIAEEQAAIARLAEERQAELSAQVK